MRGSDYADIWCFDEQAIRQRGFAVEVLQQRHLVAVRILRRYKLKLSRRVTKWYAPSNYQVYRNLCCKNSLLCVERMVVIGDKVVFFLSSSSWLWVWVRFALKLDSRGCVIAHEASSLDGYTFDVVRARSAVFFETFLVSFFAATLVGGVFCGASASLFGPVFLMVLIIVFLSRLAWMKTRMSGSLGLSEGLVLRSIGMFVGCRCQSCCALIAE